MDQQLVFCPHNFHYRPSWEDLNTPRDSPGPHLFHAALKSGNGPLSAENLPMSQDCYRGHFPEQNTHTVHPC